MTKRLDNTFTVIPISSIKTRREHPGLTKAKVQIQMERGWTVFKIYSDWGQLHMVKIHNSLKKEIEFAKQKAIENELLKP